MSGHFFKFAGFGLAALVLIVVGILLQQVVRFPQLLSQTATWQAPKYGRVLANDGSLITIELPDKTTFIFETGEKTTVVQTLRVKKQIEDIHVGSEVLLGPALSEDRSAREIEIFTAL